MAQFVFTARFRFADLVFGVKTYFHFFFVYLTAVGGWKILGLSR